MPRPTIVLAGKIMVDAEPLERAIMWRAEPGLAKRRAIIPRRRDGTRVALGRLAQLVRALA
jgi:hypothetical protein